MSLPLSIHLMMFAVNRNCRVQANLEAKNPVIRTGAEIPFMRYFYKYQWSASSKELDARISKLEKSVSVRVAELFA